MNISEWIVAQVEREQAEATERLRAGRLHPGERRSTNGVSTVFTLRLDQREHAALEARAAAVGVKPSVLARNFIRAGLTRSEAEPLEALRRIEAAVAEVRAAFEQS